jgi:hypothetical protein
MRIRSRLLALAAVGGVVATAAAVAGADGGATQAKITASFSPNGGGKPTHIIFDVVTSSTTGGVPAPGTRALVHLPLGMKVNTKGFARCNGNLTTPPDASKCAANTQVGSGSSTLAAQLGTQSINEPATVTAYVGAKQHGHDTLLLYAVGTTPISAAVTLVGELIPGAHSAGVHSAAASYGYKLDVAIPPIHTVPGAPDASITDFKVDIGKTAKVKGKKTGFLTAPKKSQCKGALHWGYDGSYSGAPDYSTTATSPCPSK